MKHIFIRILLTVAVSNFFHYQIDASGVPELGQKELYTQWFEAVDFGNIETVEKLIRIVDINAQHNGHNALMLAACRGRENIVKCLLEVPTVKFNAQDNTGQTALMCAVAYGHENIVKLLLQVPGIDLNIQNRLGDTALMTAILNDPLDENTVKLLLQHTGINVNLQDKRGNDALLLATQFGHENIVRLLLQVPSINVNAQNGKGNTALMFAVCGPKENIVQLLLQAPGLHLNAQNSSGKTALDCVIAAKNPNIERLIREKIAELTSIAFKAIVNSNLEMLKSVIAQMGDNIVDPDGKTLLDKAFTVNKPQIIQYLLTSAKDPRELLARFPFEAINPSSDLFKYFVNLAYKKLCANPACKNHVQECSKKCSACKKVYYCSVDCQKADWSAHKSHCKSS